MSGESLKEVKKELYLMLQKTREMLEFTEEAFSTNKLSPLDNAEELAHEIHAKEDAMTESLAKMASGNAAVRALVSSPAQIEKAATCIKRIVDSTRTRIKDGLLFSDKAIQETSVLFGKAKDALKRSGEVIVTGTAKAGDEVIAQLDEIERIASDFTTAHENRIISGEASPKSSTIFLCILYAFDEMAGYVKSVVKRAA